MIEINQKYEIFLLNGFRYVGEIVEDDETFLMIFDDKSGKPLIIGKNSISTLHKLGVKE